MAEVVRQVDAAVDDADLADAGLEAQQVGAQQPQHDHGGIAEKTQRDELLVRHPRAVPVAQRERSGGRQGLRREPGHGGAGLRLGGG